MIENKDVSADWNNRGILISISPITVFNQQLESKKCFRFKIQ